MPQDIESQPTTTDLDSSLQSDSQEKTHISEDSIQDDTLSAKKPKRSFFSSLKHELHQAMEVVKTSFKWEFIRILFSHHPYCKPYEKHVFILGPVRLCRGCWLSYPPMYATIFLFLFLTPFREFLLATPFWIANLWWFVIGFGIGSLVGRFLGKYSLFIKDLSKIARGLWAGVLAVVIISQHWAFKIGAAIILLGGMTYLTFHRAKDMERICQECEWNAQYNICPGFAGVTNLMNSAFGVPEHNSENQNSINPQEELEEDLETES
ncbi:hypothetical protein EU523_01390 [Candidatus Heimdallarchaeota archaeon]|nr:MAG: hypothetical protein EU523_01390 [Candidatus Heimdallarchaeota archaeon]